MDELQKDFQNWMENWERMSKGKEMKPHTEGDRIYLYGKKVKQVLEDRFPDELKIILSQTTWEELLTGGTIGEYYRLHSSPTKTAKYLVTNYTGRKFFMY